MCVLGSSVSPASRDFLASSRCYFASSHVGGQIISASAFCLDIQDTNRSEDATNIADKIIIVLPCSFDFFIRTVIILYLCMFKIKLYFL